MIKRRNQNTEYMRKWRKKNRAAYNAYQKEWRKQNPGKNAAAAKRWKQENLEKSRAISRAWSERNKERHRKNSREWNRKNPDKVRDRLLKSAFGISLSKYKEILLSQNEACAICEQPQSTLKKNLAVDHCHSTGIIRGLLCTSCNLGIGQLQESTEILSKALAYLTKSKNHSNSGNDTGVHHNKE